MQLPRDATIAPAKLGSYLLKPREDHDKAGFLALAGYRSADAARLEADIRAQVLSCPAEPAGNNPYGEKFIIRARLTGPNGRTYPVISIWMVEKATGITKFITLYPAS